jgi:transcriptional regulator with GAF, ATPase, and Fis domain
VPRFERLVSDILARLLECEDTEIDREVERSLAAIGHHVKADLVGLGALTETGEFVRGHTWLSSRFDFQREVSDAAGSRHPGLAAHLQRHGALVFESPEEHPPWPEGLSVLRRIGITAAVVVRLDGPDPPLEVLTVNVIGRRRPWPTELVERLRFLGRVLSNAVRRKQAETELRQRLAEIETLKERLEAENVLLRTEVSETREGDRIIGDGPALTAALERSRQVAGTDASVLLLGETGTGKDLFAQAIHAGSARRDRAMIKVNCAALPPTLIESELFGHERGAYTGALQRRIGRFELADGGTIFLDEIGDLPLALQAKLLRVLQDGEFERLGSTRTRRVDARVIAATSRDLLAAIDNDGFREDLYYRLCVFPIELPPLRHRREDIPQLVWYFIAKMQRKMGRKITDISPSAMRGLTDYDWPGNVRELQNTIEHALILSTGSSLELGGLLERAGRVGGTMPQASADTLEEIERAHILRVLDECKWKVAGKNGAAERLGLKRGTLQSRMKKLGIHRPQHSLGERKVRRSGVQLD